PTAVFRIGSSRGRRVIGSTPNWPTCMSASCKRGVRLETALRHLCPRVALEHKLAGAGAEPPRKRWIAQDRIQPIMQCLDIARWHEKAGPAILNDLDQAADTAGDHRGT